jgi:hypothetical protein
MPYRILSIDGGGIRGVLPATVLARLEELSGQPIARLFDLIVGTSTGGILALGLTVPGNDGSRPAHRASELLGLYEAEAGTIFPGGGPPNWSQRIFGTRDPTEWLRDPGGIMNRSAQAAGSIAGGSSLYAGGARYFVVGLEEVLARYVGNAQLPTALTDVVVTSYDLANDEPVLFSSRERPGCITQISMSVAARATSAGPTYFEPQVVIENGRSRALVDGGVYVNNPAMLAYTIGAANAGGEPIVLLSLGTGTRSLVTPRTPDQVKTANWLAMARMVMEAAMTGGGELGDAMLTKFLPANDRYWRIQTDVGLCNFAMDDSSAGNVDCLKRRAFELVAAQNDLLTDIASALTGKN